MKRIVLISMLFLSFSTFAGEVLTCKLGAKETINITKVKNNYFYNVNGKTPSKLSSAQTLQKNDLRKESFLRDLMEHTQVPTEEVSRANVYTLTQDEDGGKTIVRFIFNDNTYVAVYVSMGRIAPCL